MSDTPNTPGETVNAGDSPNNGTNNGTQTSNTIDTAEVDRLRKAAEQAQLRANQLENEKTARDKADEEARQKQLEEQNEWKQVAEQKQARLDELEKERTDANLKQTLTTAENTVLAEFPEEVKTLAKELGLTLQSDTEDAKAEFKQKLDTIKSRGPAPKVKPNNPGATSTTTDRATLVEQMRRGDKNARAEVIRGLPALDQMRRDAGLVE